MKSHNIILLILASFLHCASVAAATSEAKPRLLVLTDIGGDPNDQMSMVRLMTYANHMDIEGLVATPPGGESGPVNPDIIRKIVAAYGKVRNNLALHEPGFPTEDHLQQRIVAGLPLGHMEAVGKGNGTTGSRPVAGRQRGRIQPALHRG